MQKKTIDPLLKRPRFNCDLPSSYHDRRIAEQIFVRIRNHDTQKAEEPK